MNAGFSVLDGMALFIAFIVLFKFFCAFFYLSKWNFRSLCGGADYARPDRQPVLPDKTQQRVYAKMEKNYEDFESKIRDLTPVEKYHESRMVSLFSNANHQGVDFEEVERKLIPDEGRV